LASPVSLIAFVIGRSGAGLVRDEATTILESVNGGISRLGVATGADGSTRDETEVGSGLIGAEIGQNKNNYFD
jgi:hypothetical protein